MDKAFKVESTWLGFIYASRALIFIGAMIGIGIYNERKISDSIYYPIYGESIYLIAIVGLALLLRKMFFDFKNRKTFIVVSENKIKYSRRVLDSLEVKSVDLYRTLLGRRLMIRVKQGYHIRIFQWEIRGTLPELASQITQLNPGIPIVKWSKF
jgi:hypothetical protein